MRKTKWTKDVYEQKIGEMFNGRIGVFGSDFYFYNNKQPFFCKDHGYFEATPCDLIREKRVGCRQCGMESSRSRMIGTSFYTGKVKSQYKLVCGVGVRDDHISSDRKITKTGRIWHGILERCYSKNKKDKFKSYADCSVSEDWLTYSNFKRDVESMVGYDEDGWHLDKDILFKGNRVYSKDTCCFVPQHINARFKRPSKNTTGLPSGVQIRNSGKTLNYISTCCDINCKKVYLGRFENIDEAKNAYAQAQHHVILEMVDLYKDKLDNRVIEALIKRADDVLLTRELL